MFLNTLRLSFYQIILSPKLASLSIQKIKTRLIFFNNTAITFRQLHISIHKIIPSKLLQK